MPAVESNTCRGVRVELSDLLALRFQARLKLSAHKRSLNTLAGPYRASFRGRGIDFEEVRAYQAGDDVRSIDWRVTARTTEPHTKLFREEKERPVILLIDQRQNLFFGTRRCFKSVLAAHTAATLAWSALRNGDRVGGLVMSCNDLIESRPRRSKRAVLQLLHETENANHRLGAPGTEVEDTSLLSALRELRRLCKPGTVVLLISDFHDFDENCTRQLVQLSRHNQVTAYRVFDAMEMQLPNTGRYQFSDGVEHTRIDLGQNNAGKHFSILARMQLDSLRDGLGKAGVPLIDLQTGCNPGEELLRYYHVARQR